ncbi:hypothetical protein VKT23_012768 [Stygiomarasmius scandens]|uniref:rhamnogalacturonan endolyase n=1 Tax=Marasmiellus scandens TaxID=2682957 RepID=A0ABR1J5V0_9AGAR
MLVLRALVSLSLLVLPKATAFGVTESGNSLTIDTSGGLIFTVDKTNGDITSMKFNGIEAQDQSGKHSQVNSGIGAPCSWVQTGNEDNYIKITCTTTNLTHYYVARRKDPAVHMATFTTAEPSIGLIRYIARLNRATLPNGYTVSDVLDGTAIEGSDVFLVDGQTRSKYYSSRQFIDDQVHGVTGPNIGAYMIIPGAGYESSSGGPFFRDHNNQGSAQQELYFYTSFWDGLSVSGFVNQASRGRVTGTATGIPSAFSSLISIGFSNSAAQYWVRTDTSGRFTSPYMKPGTYTMTLYKVELGVSTQTVTVSAGGLTTSNIASQESSPSVIWQIGDFDGTPRGFLNADMIETMHPSDKRMHSWGPVTYTVGQEDIGFFPMAIFKAIGAVTIRFALQSGQGGARTLDIGTTLAFAGGRPQVTINDWTGPAPPAPNQPRSRGVTRGTWRGNNIMYTVNIPSDVLHTGSTINVMTINVISGDTGDEFLSPNVIFDALRLY